MADEYDVFLVPNPSDAAAVEAIAKRLRAEPGLRVFWDEWDVVPGEVWIEAIERAIERSRTIAVFYGAQGLGRWQDEQKRLALHLAVQRQAGRVIPVLLPGGRAEDVRGLMSLRTPVDYSRPDGYLRLMAGIRGVAPGPGAPTPPSPAVPGPTTIASDDAQALDRELVAELARVLWNGENAQLVVRRAGFPRERMPAFTSSLVFWTRVAEEVTSGGLVDGIKAIVDEAARQYPGNAVFQRHRVRYAAQAVQASAAVPEGASPKGSSPASASPVVEPPRSSPEVPTQADDDAVDVVLLTALHDEYLAVLDVSDGALDPAWVQEPSGPVGRLVARRRFRGVDGPITVLATWAEDIAGNAAAGIGGMLVEKFRPRCLAMTGIAAGRRGKVELGDVVFGRCLFTHDAGKVVARGAGAERTVRIDGDPNPYRLDSRWKQRVEVFAAEHDRRIGQDPPEWARGKPLTLEWQGQWVLARLLENEPPIGHPERKRWCPDWKPTIERLRARGLLQTGSIAPTKQGRRLAKEHADLHPDGLEPPPPVRVRLGDIASGNSVVEDDEIFARISRSMRKTIGLEMETAAIASVAALGGVPWVVAKAICDFGDEDKDDRFHAFAARASAECLLAFLRAHADLLGPRSEGTSGAAKGGARGESVGARGGSDARSDEPASPVALQRDGVAAGEGGGPAGDGTSEPSGVPLEPPPWEAIPELTRILSEGPKAFVEALARALGMPTEAEAESIARVIDALGGGPHVAARLLDVCVAAWTEVKRTHPGQLRAASSTALVLSSTWLPRRYGDGSQVRLIPRPDAAASHGYCHDMAVVTRDPIMIDVHVSGADGIASKVEVIRRPAKDGTTTYGFIGARRLPKAEGPLGEMKSAQEVARAMVEGYAEKFDLSREPDPKYRQIRMNAYLRHQRRVGEPRHVVADPKVASKTLVELKKIYPALRVVTIEGPVDYFEAEIVPVLADFMVHASEPSPGGA